MGVFSEKYDHVINRAKEALLDAINENGKLCGVSAATPPGAHGDIQHYNQIPVSGPVPWGQGPAILALLEQWRRADEP